MAAGEQYFRLAINFASIAAVSRLLTPTEIGVSVIGTGIVLIAMGLREFATSDFLIQRQEITRDDIRASFTVVFLLTVLITIAMFMVAPWFGAFYGEEKLARFLRIAAVAGLIEALSLHIRGLLRRDMAFGALALINTASAAATAGVTILLAFVGFSFMSVAWAMLAAAGATTSLSFYFRPDLAIFRPTLQCLGQRPDVRWLQRRELCDQSDLPDAAAARSGPSAPAFCGRPLQSGDDGVRYPGPDRLDERLFGGFSRPLPLEVREGRSLKEAYLRALGYITVLYWPALILLALLAHPVILLLLGQQWLSVIPLLQVMAVAGLAWFPVILTSPVLLAVGANRDRVLADFLGRSLSAVFCAARPASASWRWRRASS